MGGHGHDPGFKIPSPDIYKLENYPALLEFQERLAKEGLKDPWLRNEAWRYHPSLMNRSQGILSLFRGWKLGIPAFLITITIEKLVAMYKKDDHDQDGHH